MSNNAKATAKSEPYISEYDQYVGVYRSDPPTIETEHGSFSLSSGLDGIRSGQKVLIGGRCRYKTVREADSGDKVPIDMEPVTCYPISY